MLVSPAWERRHLSCGLRGGLAKDLRTQERVCAGVQGSRGRRYCSVCFWPLSRERLARGEAHAVLPRTVVADSGREADTQKNALTIAARSPRLARFRQRPFKLSSLLSRLRCSRSHHARAATPEGTYSSLCPTSTLPSRCQHHPGRFAVCSCAITPFSIVSYHNAPPSLHPSPA